MIHTVHNSRNLPISNIICIPESFLPTLKSSFWIINNLFEIPTHTEIRYIMNAGTDTNLTQIWYGEF